jgi:Retroviral aspartyl protease
LRSTLVGQPNPKRQKTENLIPLLIGYLVKELDDSKPNRPMRILLDSGASTSIVATKVAKELPKIKTEKTVWSTVAGTFETFYKSKGQLIFSKLFKGRTIPCELHLSDTMTSYDVIVGRDILQALGITLNFADLTIEWDGASTPMKSIENTYSDFKRIEAFEDTFMPQALKRINDAKYEKANLEATAEASAHLSRAERRQLLKLLVKHERLFEGKLGRWKNTKCKIKLKPGVTPYHARAYPVPKSREAQLKLEVERLCKEGVLKKVNRSEWAAPTFAIPKKDGSIRFISDFQELNARIKRTPFPIPKIQDLMLKLEGF